MHITAPHRLLAAGLVAILAAALLAACAAPSAGTSTGSSDKGNAATVNGTPITNAEFNRQVKAVTDSLVSQNSLDVKTDVGKATVDQVRSDILEQLIQYELIRQAAAKEGITVTDAEVDAQMAQSIQDAGGADAFKASLQQANFTEQDFRNYVIRDQMLYEGLYNKIAGGAVPAAADQVHSRHILVNTEQEANDILARLQKGEDFAKLAAELSQDGGSKDAGGDLGFFPRGVVVAAFEDAIFSMAPNETRVVQTDYGYHVVQVLEKASNVPLSADIQQALAEQALGSYMDNLRSAAKIVILAKLGPTPTPSE